MMGVNTYNNDDLVKRLYKLYLKEDKSDFGKAVRRCIEISSRHR